MDNLSTKDTILLIWLSLLLMGCSATYLYTLDANGVYVCVYGEDFQTADKDEMTKHLNDKHWGQVHAFKPKGGDSIIKSILKGRY